MCFVVRNGRKRSKCAVYAEDRRLDICIARRAREPCDGKSCDKIRRKCNTADQSGTRFP